MTEDGVFLDQAWFIGGVLVGRERESCVQVTQYCGYKERREENAGHVFHEIDMRTIDAVGLKAWLSSNPWMDNCNTLRLLSCASCYALS